jgi:uncharacterized protein (TIGR03083 family)
MTTAAVDALRADHEAFATLAATLTDDEWAAPSACAGWTVRDVLGHLTQLFRQFADPAALPPGDPEGRGERTQDIWVAAVRRQPVEQVLADYRRLGEQTLAGLAGLQGSDTPISLGDLGAHPLHLIANAYAFDHYTHIRADLLAPEGPLDHPAPPADAAHLGAVADWIVAGIPQMSPAAVTRPLDLVLTGPGARTVHLGPDEPPAATVASSIPDLVRWSTGRRSWKELDVEITGDAAAATHFCETVHVF